MDIANELPLGSSEEQKQRREAEHIDHSIKGHVKKNCPQNGENLSRCLQNEDGTWQFE